MPTSFTKETKPTISVNTQWNSANGDWASNSDTWESTTDNYNKEAKPSNSFTKETKP